MNKFHNGKSIYVKSVQLRVRDINKSIEFYQDILKMKVHYRSKEEVWLGNAESIFLTLQEGSFEARKRSAGLYHFAILFGVKEELGAVLQSIIASGYKLQGAADHDVSEAIYLQDLDGHGIELYVDQDPSRWTWNKEEVYMDTKMLDVESILKVADKNLTILSKTTILGHVHLSVLDTRKSKAFYELLGFESMLDIDHAVFMSSQEYHHHLAINTWGMLGGTLHSNKDIDIKEMVIQYPNQAKLAGALENLKNANVQYELFQDIVELMDPNQIPIRLVVGQ